MSYWVLSCKKPIASDASAALFQDGELVFAIEEERLVREKHAPGRMAENAIRACLDYCGLELEDVDKIVFPDVSRLRGKLLREQLYTASKVPESLPAKMSELEDTVEKQLAFRFVDSTSMWANTHLRDIGSVENVKLETHSHHGCHAASVLFCDEFEEGMILTIDGKGEHDSTVIWKSDEQTLERVKTYKYPNSLGIFYGIITEYLGYIHKNGEGKVMGLAPYGSRNREIESVLRNFVTAGHDYDTKPLTRGDVEVGVKRLEAAFGRKRETDPGAFSQWQKDLAFTAQSLLEEIIVDVVEHYAKRLDTTTVGLTGGVALNCKMNKRIMESDVVGDLVVQPIAHDGGLAIGGGILGSPSPVLDMTNAYYGPSYPMEGIEELLETNKIEYETVDDIERTVAEEIADGNLVGWFQGRLEMGPRALGNRSILADPRTDESRDRVNEFVKHREGWRPFAPSMLERAVDEYLVDGQPAPYMIRTFDVEPDKRDEISAVLHPADDTTRPQTVREEQNPRYYRLIHEFEEITGVPVVLNTSFNDHAEPIVNKPVEAIKDFFGMGLDVLAIEDAIVYK
jgi:carbamoyltransferase